MCGPVAGIAKGLFGAMGAIAEHNAKVEDFNNQEQRWQENYALSRDAAMDEHNQITAKSVQMSTEAGVKNQVYAEEAAVAAAEAEASAAGANVEGNTVGEVVRSIVSGAARNRHFARLNFNNQMAQIAKEQKATVTNFKARVASVQRPTPPNPAGAFLGIAGAVLGAF